MSNQRYDRYDREHHREDHERWHDRHPEAPDHVSHERWHRKSSEASHWVATIMTWLVLLFVVGGMWLSFDITYSKASRALKLAQKISMEKLDKTDSLVSTGVYPTEWQDEATMAKNLAWVRESQQGADFYYWHDLQFAGSEMAGEWLMITFALPKDPNICCLEKDTLVVRMNSKLAPLLPQLDKLSETATPIRIAAELVTFSLQDCSVVRNSSCAEGQERIVFTWELLGASPDFPRAHWLTPWLPIEKKTS